jgi:hypothetical protein
MARRATDQRKRPKTAAPRRPAKRPNKRITIPNPMYPDVMVWEIELLDISEAEFRELWDTGNDRIGFNLGERTIYDKNRVVARIAKEVRLPKSPEMEEE